MAFDAIFTAAIAKELSYMTENARVEKIFQPSKDTVIISLRLEKGRENGGGQNRRLLIDCGTSSPRICLTDLELDNPKTPPMFCMLLRKHLTASRIVSVRQMGFERVIEITLESRDELGYLSNKYIYAELMGKFSNLIFCGPDKKVVSAFHLTDLSGSAKRPLIPGIKYELPPQQEGKISPLDENAEALSSALSLSVTSHAKFLQNRYYGISPLVARELEYRAEGENSLLIKEISALVKRIKEEDFVPTLIEKHDGSPLEYSFMPIFQYGNEAKRKEASDFSALIDGFFAQRSKNERIRQRASDILRLLTNAETRLTKRIALQKEELALCAEKESYKNKGDLITANLHALKRGMTEVKLIDYYDENCPTVTLTLDSRLTPAQNAQRYYKKYNKCKSAEIHLKEQLEKGEAELKYLDTVFDALTRTETEADLNEIRRELYESGYAGRMKNYSSFKTPAPKPAEYRTSSGWRVLCGKNNAQNDYITFKLASKGDIWFHIKDYPGSHVVLFCDGEEPDAIDFTEAATLAAYCSKAPAGQRVTVDYTRIKNVKKPPNAKPGFVTFSSNYSAYVVPDASVAEAMKARAKQ